MNGRVRRSRRAGFTLVELLAVLLILTILLTFVVTTVMRGQGAVEVHNTEMFISQVQTLISEYETEHGDFPKSSFPATLDPKPSKTNMGSEMLLIELYPADGTWQAREVDDARLGNSDGDTTKKSHTSFSSADAFELSDDWGNPIAYIHRRDYEKGIVYVTYDTQTGEMYEAEVKGAINPKTGDPFNKRSYQLISAGLDGKFDTGDEIANFEFPAPEPD